MRAALKSAAEIVEIVEGYVKDARDHIERQVPNLRSDENPATTCTNFVDSCSCARCQPGGGTWQPPANTPDATGYSIDFRSVSVTHVGNTDKSSDKEREAQCLAMLAQPEFKSIARLEYNDHERMAFLYYGDQGSGVMVSWPGQDYCPTAAAPFDPRFRPWYVSAVSGPKDVVIVLDRSASMQGDRWLKARQAAKDVLGTLTRFDYTNVVLFSSTAVSYDGFDTLLPATEENIRLMREWLDLEGALGGTNFRAGLQKAFNNIATGIGSGKTSGCNRAVLFLTDGEDRSGMELSEVEDMNDIGATIFTYSFGNEADKTRPKQIACRNKGIWYHVPDGAHIGNVMSGYYTYYAGALARTKQIRWTMYEEIRTKNELITGCLPVYFRNSEADELLGVVCMDVSIIIATDTFKAKSDFQAAQQAMIDAASTCNAVSLDEEELEQLRRRVSQESVCAGDNGNGGNSANGARATVGAGPPRPLLSGLAALLVAVATRPH